VVSHARLLLPHSVDIFRKCRGVSTGNRHHRITVQQIQRQHNGVQCDALRSRRVPCNSRSPLTNCLVWVGNTLWIWSKLRVLIPI
jgi:hypothetical protein